MGVVEKYSKQKIQKNSEKPTDRPVDPVPVIIRVFHENMFFQKKISATHQFQQIPQKSP